MNQTLGRTMSQAGLPKRAAPATANITGATKPARPVACRVAAEAATAWDAWDGYMAKKKPVKNESTEEKKLFAEIGEAITKSSVGYKPKFNIPHDTQASILKLQHMPKLPVKELPKDLHDKLETIGAATLKGALAMDSDVDYANVSYTTTDIDGALSMTGTVMQKGSDKSAVVVLVATETEREASWSRLEGLVLHWACGSAPGGAWSMPPEGWTAAPSKTTDTGGAWECQFEKQTLSGNEQMYVLVLQLPMRGVLKSGGLLFVLKGTNSKADRWLQDASTGKDFFLDLQTLPVTKV